MTASRTTRDPQTQNEAHPDEESVFFHTALFRNFTVFFSRMRRKNGTQDKGTSFSASDNVR